MVEILRIPVGILQTVSEGIAGRILEGVINGIFGRVTERMSENIAAFLGKIPGGMNGKT